MPGIQGVVFGKVARMMAPRILSPLADGREGQRRLVPQSLAGLEKTAGFPDNSNARRGGRAADCTGLENRRDASHRGFESLPLRFVL